MACYRIQKITEKGSTAMSSMYDIPRFWINLNGLAHSSNLNIVESCITRVFCMQGALSFHRWLLEVIPAAVHRQSRNTWLEKLAWDVERAIFGKREVTFNSASYLPNLAFHSVYLLRPMVLRYEATDIIISIVSSIVRLWLGFPSDEFSLLQLSLIDILTSKSLPSILFLDKIWEMYKTPFTTVFKKWDKRTSKTQLKISLEKFEETFTHHTFATTNSLEYERLKLLSDLITQWTETYGITPHGDVDTVSQILPAFFIYYYLFHCKYLAHGRTWKYGYCTIFNRPLIYTGK